MRITVLAAAAVLLAACVRESETDQTAARLKAQADTARLAIEAQDARLVKFIAAAQADSFASIYAEDAVLYPANSPAVRGRAAIAAALRAWFATGSVTYAPTILSVEASDPIAIETGQNIITFTPGPTAPAGTEASTDTAIYVTIWKRIGSQWLISKDIGTSAKPTHPAPATQD